MSISVVASGLVTAIGFNAAACLAALRAKISGVKTEKLYDLQAGQYLRAARVRLPQWWEGIGKLAELLAPAIAECMDAADGVDSARIPVLLCLPEPGPPDRLGGTPAQLVAALQARLGRPLSPLSRTLAQGQVSAVAALVHARALLAQNDCAYCIVAGVDSFLRQSVVDAYIAPRRVMTASNSNGFFPGEAASAVLLRQSRPDGPELRLLGLGLGREAATIASDLPLQAKGLCAAVQGALGEASVAFHDVDYRIADANGEHYKFKEATLLVGRLMRKRKPERFELWHPVESLGEIGAAIGPAALAQALHAGLHGYAPGPTVLCHFGSDGGDRAAAVLRYT
ncbi:hypothetical protein [Pseudorhodoferax sp. Leaf267]|uniref:hypothetical protein n=1 Tax=Pseudorhodoferax sp. Leaf267 TaxID=1736316 RepID=UPI0006FBDCC2|nr:hypothetical protein [Pseudorhodoferax sp. Leaf267]KQP22423.1 hypothetical protein ASF43_00370 [Pseudorhodoferax sp. Leaf267]